MRIGELAALASTTTRALRYYESRGLLQVRRDARGYRVYDEDDHRVLRQIQTLQECGFDLEEIRPFVECLQAGSPSGDACPTSAEVYRRKVAELDDLIGQLQGVRSWILGQLQPGLDDQPRPPRPLCELTAPGLLPNGIGRSRQTAVTDPAD
ncbi:MerR family transcriptional regulator [Nocardia sp. NPDC004415]